MSNVRALAVLEEFITVVTGRPRSGRRTSRCSQPACLQRWPGPFVPQAGGQHKVRAASEERESEPSSEAKCFPALSARSCCPAEPRPPIPVRLAMNESDVHALSAEPSTTNRRQREGQCWLRQSRLIAVTGRAAVHRSQSNSACFGQHCLTPRQIQERFVNQLPNPSVEGTSTIRLRLLAAAPHLKR